MFRRLTPTPRAIPAPVIEAFDSLFQILTVKTDTTTGKAFDCLGTGFKTADGLVTAKHVLQPSPNTTISKQIIIRPGQRPLNIGIATSVGDVALFQTDGDLDSPPLMVRDLAQLPLKPGETVYMMRREPTLAQSQPIPGAIPGYKPKVYVRTPLAALQAGCQALGNIVDNSRLGSPDPMTELASRPAVQASRPGQSWQNDGIPPSQLYIIDTAVAKTEGSSGSPVVDEQGRVVGVHSMGGLLASTKHVTQYLPTGDQRRGYGIAQHYPKQF
jgi:hypothetical protein